MEACYGGTDVMERSCAVARGIDINTFLPGTNHAELKQFPLLAKACGPRAPGVHLLARSGYFSSPSFSRSSDSNPGKYTPR
jgi:hypothetical protein